jgi:hypothetical protein
MSIAPPKIDTRSEDVAARSPVIEHEHSSMSGGVRPSGHASARRLRNWLILANVAGWILIVVAVREIFF